MVHIETKNRTYDTEQISLSHTPAKNGLYFIRDADGKAVFGSADLEMAKKIYEHALKEAADKGTVSSRELKKFEYSLSEHEKKQENEKEETPQSSAEEPASKWDSLKQSLAGLQNLEQQAESERQKLIARTSEIELSEAPQELLDMLNDFVSRKPFERVPENDIPPELKQTLTENDYLAYRLTNRLLDRASAAFKAGIVSAFDKIISPVQKICELHLEKQIESCEKAGKVLQEKLEAYMKHLSDKVEKRLERANHRRIRSGQQPYPEGTLLYTAREQSKINQLSTNIRINRDQEESYSMSLEHITTQHQNRLNYIQENRDISKNTRILDNHKKSVVQVKLSDPAINKENLPQDKSPDTEKQQAEDLENHETISKNEEAIIPPDDMITNDPEQDTLSSEEMAKLFNDDLQSVEPAQPAENSMSLQDSCRYAADISKAADCFEPIEERFANAREESSNNKSLVNAKLVYRAIDHLLPANAAIEFEVSGNAFIASKNEYGDLFMKKYSYDTAKYEAASKEQVLEDFRKEPAAYEQAVREQLGEVVIGAPDKTLETEP